MIIGFTGTQTGMSAKQQQTVTRLLENNCTNYVQLHHGGCVGADATMHELWSEIIGYDVIVHPARDVSSDKIAVLGGRYKRLMAYPPLERNHHIVDVCQLLVACPRIASEELRSGTWATIRYARRQQRPVALVLPDGRLRLE